MLSSFDDYFDWLMTWEGCAYENVAGDSGGATKCGIDKASHPDVNIYALTCDEAKEIYRKDYWSAVRGSELPWPLDVVVMDIAVNNGRTRAVQWLQDAVGATPDGVFGPKTMKAVKAADAMKTAKKLLTRREAFYRAIAKGQKAKFMKGWLNRNNSLVEYIK